MRVHICAYVREKVCECTFVRVYVREKMCEYMHMSVCGFARVKVYKCKCASVRMCL